jgi:hypothetical protein
METQMDDNSTTPEANPEAGDDDAILASVQVWEPGARGEGPVHVAFGHLAGRGVLLDLDDGRIGDRPLSAMVAAKATDVLLGRANPAKGVEHAHTHGAILMLSHRSVLSAGDDRDVRVTREEAEDWVEGRRPAALRPLVPADPDLWLAQAADAEQTWRAPIVRRSTLTGDEPSIWPNICCLLGWTCCQGQHPDPPPEPLVPPTPAE